MTPDPAQEALFQKALESEDRAFREILLVGLAARQEIADQLRHLNTEYQTFVLTMAERAVEEALTEFAKLAAQEQTAHFGRMWGWGQAVADVPLVTIGLTPSLVGANEQVLRSLQGYAASQVRGLTAEEIRRLSDGIRVGILAGRTTTEIERAVLGDLRTFSAGDADFGHLERRTLTIVRTEGGNVMNTAHELQFRDDRRLLPSLGKAWWTNMDGRERESHAEMNGERANAEGFFDLRGVLCVGPHDARLPAREVVHCRCRAYAVMPDN